MKNANQVGDAKSGLHDTIKSLLSSEDTDEALRNIVPVFMIDALREVLFKVTEEFHCNGGIEGLHDHSFIMAIQSLSRMIDVVEKSHLRKALLQNRD